MLPQGTFSLTSSIHLDANSRELKGHEQRLMYLNKWFFYSRSFAFIRGSMLQVWPHAF